MANITFLAPDTDAFVASVQKHINEYEEKTGDKVFIKILPNDLYFSNNIQEYFFGEESIDIFMSGPVLIWEHIGSNLVEPLDDFISNSGDDYNPNDFVPNLLKANRWTGKDMDPLGNGFLYSIPVNCESYNLAYVPELLDKYNLNIPTTWDQYFSEAKKIVDFSNSGIRGFAQRGANEWHTVYTGFATQLWSYGGSDFNLEGNSDIASRKNIDTTKMFINALRESGPENWTSQRWYELAIDFAQKKYGFIVDSDHYVAFFENPTYSKLVGKIQYDFPPKSYDGTILSNLWTWSIAMSSHSKQKQAAWRFIEWVSSKDFLLRSAFEGNMNPTRLSIWNDDSFIEHTKNWGNFTEVSKKLIETHSRVLVTPIVNYRKVALRWTHALRESYLGMDVSESLSLAQQDIDLFLRK